MNKIIHQRYQIKQIGFYWLIAARAVFRSPTSGEVQSFVRLMDEDWTGFLVQAKFGIPPHCPCPQTVETSVNLQWFFSDQANSASFMFAEGVADQGISYRPTGAPE